VHLKLVTGSENFLNLLNSRKRRLEKIVLLLWTIVPKIRGPTWLVLSTIGVDHSEEVVQLQQIDGKSRRGVVAFAPEMS